MTLPYSVSRLYDALVSASPQAVDEVLRQNSFLWDRFRKERRTRRPEWQLEDELSEASSFTVGGSLPAGGASETTTCILNWGNYTDAVKLADRQIKEAMEGGATVFGDLVEQQVRALGRRIKDKIALDLISGATDSETAGTIIGLCGGAIEDDNVYANQNRSTVAAAAPFVSDNGGSGRAVSTTLLDAVLDEVEMERNGRVTVGFCDVNQWNAISALTGNNVTIETKNGDAGMPGLSKFLGCTSLFYRGIPIVKVPNYTAGRVDFVDENEVSIAYLPKEGLESDEAAASMFDGSIMDAIDIKTPQRQGDSYVWQCFIYVQLVLRNAYRSAASLQDLS